MSGIIDDRRTEQERGESVWLVVATDSSMSGWGGAPGKSYYAVPATTWEEAKVVADNLRARKEMKRIRFVPAKGYRPRLSSGDHLSIASRSMAARYYQVGGFNEEGE